MSIDLERVDEWGDEALGVAKVSDITKPKNKLRIKQWTANNLNKYIGALFTINLV